MAPRAGTYQHLCKPDQSDRALKHSKQTGFLINFSTLFTLCQNYCYAGPSSETTSTSLSILGVHLTH